MLETVCRLADAYGLETWQLIGPELPDNTKLKGATPVPPAKVHYLGKK